MDVHKEALRLYMHEMEKPEGGRMSLRQVHDHIKKVLWCEAKFYYNTPVCKGGAGECIPQEDGQKWQPIGGDIQIALRSVF